MSFFSGLNDEKYDRQYTDRVLTSRIIGYFKPQKKRFAIVSVLVVALAAIGAALPVVQAVAVIAAILGRARGLC